MADIAIRGGWVVAWGEKGHQVLDSGTVVVEGNRIVFVGFPDDPACPSAERVIDARGKLVSPGLINLHGIANLDLQVLRIDGNPTEGYNRPASVLDPGTPHILSDADFRTSAEFCVAAMLKAGNTSFGQVTTGFTMPWSQAEPEPHALAEAADAMGARAWLARFYQEGCDYTEPDGTRETVWDRSKAQAGLDSAIDFIRYLRGRADGRLTGFLFPYRTEKCSDELLQETMRQSRRLGNVHVRSHFSQRLDEFQNHKAKSSRTMVEWLQDIEFLGPQVCLTHARYIAGHSATGDPPGNDLDILARTGTSVCFCPVVSARNGRTMESFSRYVAAGINMGLGTDTFPPDLVEEMRVGALINKVINGQQNAGTVRDFYNACTIGGAKALGRDDLGRLAPGCTADISIFNLPGISAGPVDDPMRTFVHFCDGWDCDMVLVDGKVVVEGGNVVGVDEEDLANRAQQTWKKYKAGLVAWDQAKRPADVLIPPLFPIAGRNRG
ncbi:MAG: chlorohydrolase family protein [Dehalococcoidia bacterium]